MRTACARSLHCSVLQLQVSESSSLLPIRQLGPSGDADFYVLLSQDAEMDSEYSDVLTSALDGQLPDISEKDGLVWYTPVPDVQPCLFVPQGNLCQLLISEAHDPTTSGHLGIHKTHEQLHRL